MMSIMALKSKRLQLLITAPTAALAITVGSLLTFNAFANPKTWSRTLSIEPANSISRGHVFELYDINQSETELVGTWLYLNGSVGNRPARAVRVSGRIEKGAFWPDVVLQVKEQASGNWITIGKASRGGERRLLLIGPNERKFDLAVNLNGFKPLIDRYETARIVLKTGEASQFQLSYLAPPRETNSNTKAAAASFASELRFGEN